MYAECVRAPYGLRTGLHVELCELFLSEKARITRSESSLLALSRLFRALIGGGAREDARDEQREG